MSLVARIRLAQKRGLAAPQARLQNFEPKGDTARSVEQALKHRSAHCIEGAMIAAFALWLQGHPPLLLDFSAHQDMDHVIAPFRINGKWGAISKTNYVCLRWRDPVYRSVRELAPPEKWVNNPKDCWEIADRITAAKHYEIVTDEEAKGLRPRDKVEVASDKITVFPVPKWKKQRL
ncbi:MAG: hypothetical protein EBU04_05010 [Verrucomicrobia bacterium]|nr:hypothetical protein [Verrucomicrobiota bacterium]